MVQNYIALHLCSFIYLQQQFIFRFFFAFKLEQSRENKTLFVLKKYDYRFFFSLVVVSLNVCLLVKILAKEFKRN